MISQGNLLSNAAALVEAWEMTAEDVILHVMPLYHTHGLFISTNAVLAAGASMIMLNDFSPAEVIAFLPDTTVMMGVPNHYATLLESDRFAPGVTSRLRLCVSGGGPLGAKTISQFEQRTGHRILERHGMTELGVSASNPYVGARKAGTVGKALPEISVRVTDLNSGRPVPQDEAGVVEVSGPNVFLGYWGRPELEAAAFRRDGYFVTGDIGRFDEDGYLEILGRRDDLIITRGVPINAREIEDVIDAAPGVREATVIGVPHTTLGEAVVAIVVPKNSERPTEEDVREFAASKLGSRQQPLRIFFVSDLPRGATGKVQKRVLRDTHRTVFDVISAPPRSVRATSAKIANRPDHKKGT
jgi:malonyl-CoA/methylmalonyl-CoA synthetase